MDISLSPQSLYGALGSAAAPLVIDVRRRPAYAADDGQIASAIRRDPESVAAWLGRLPDKRPAVVYCVDGHEVSQGVAAALSEAGRDARYLAGGIAAWREARLPTMRKTGGAPGTWVTRERPTIDRIACPWLVSRFIDPEASFVYLPADKVRDTVARTG